MQKTRVTGAQVPEGAISLQKSDNAGDELQKEKYVLSSMLTNTYEDVTCTH